MINGLEIDQFDIPEAYYLIHRGDDGEVNGSTRLMTTDGPYLLGDVFPEMIKDQTPPRTNAIWESTRFCADNQTAPRQIAGILMAGMLEFALAMGIRNYVSVSDIRMETIIRRAGWATRRMGDVQSTGKEMSAAEWFEVSQQDYNNVCAKTQISGPVITNLNHLNIERAA